MRVVFVQTSRERWGGGGMDCVREVLRDTLLPDELQSRKMEGSTRLAAEPRPSVRPFVPVNKRERQVMHGVGSQPLSRYTQLNPPQPSALLCPKSTTEPDSSLI